MTKYKALAMLSPTNSKQTTVWTMEKQTRHRTEMLKHKTH